MKYLLPICIAIALFTVSCDDSAKLKQLDGDWKCSSWLSVSGVEQCNDNVFFSFSKEGTYESKMGDVAESGKIKVQSDLLYIHPDGKMEFAVQMIKLTESELELLMNRAGNDETLKLERIPAE